MSFHKYLVHLSYVIYVGVRVYVCLCVHVCACTYMHVCVCLHMYMCGAEDGIHDPVHARQMVSPEPYPQPLRQME